IAERRVDRLVNPLTSEGLPPFLSPYGGLHSGYMLAQYVAAALVAEMKTLAHPASVDSIPTSGLQEDYNSMGTGAALKLRRVLGPTGRGAAQWTEREGRLIYRGGATVGWALVKDTSVSNGFVQVRFRSVGGREDRAGGVIWRWRDPRNYYAARAHALAGNVQAFRVVGGRRDDLVPHGGVTGFDGRGATSRAWHTLRVDFAGAEFLVSLDGRRLFTV